MIDQRTLGVFDNVSEIKTALPEKKQTTLNTVEIEEAMVNNFEWISTQVRRVIRTIGLDLSITPHFEEYDDRFVVYFTDIYSEYPRADTRTNIGIELLKLFLQQLCL